MHTVVLYSMKFRVLLASLFCAAIVHGQNIPRPVFLKINMKGEVVPLTLDPFAPVPQEEDDPVTDSAITYDILSTCSHHNGTDTSRDVRYGALADFNFEYNTYQRQLSTYALYPEIMHPNFGVSFFFLNDSVSTRSYFVDGYVCSNGGHYQYSFNEQWLYRPDGTLRSITTYDPAYSDTTSIVYTYEWFPSGQLRMMSIVSSVFLYEEWHRDTLTMEITYDKKMRPLAQVAYVGAKIDSLPQSIAEWTAQIQSKDFSYYNGQPKDRNGVEATYVLVYRYENDHLQSSFVYDKQWSASISDTLQYDAKGRLIRFRSYFNEEVTEITYTYDKKGRVLSKHETTTVTDGDGTVRVDGEERESYSYDAQKRISTVDYFWPDDQYPNKVVARVIYR